MAASGGFACMIVFLDINGTELDAAVDATIDFIFGHLEAGAFRKDVLDAWLRAHAAPRSSA